VIAATVDGATWLAQVSGVTTQLNRVACASTTTCWAVGPNNGAGTNATVVATTNGGTTWSPQNSNTTQTLNAITCTDANKCWAVGAAGTIVATTNGGSSWSAQTSGTATQLNGVACATASACWAVGNAAGNAVIVATTDGGSSWGAQTSGTTGNLQAVAFPSAMYGWAVGAGGTVIAYTGCGGGSLGVSAPGSISFPARTLSAGDQTYTTTAVITPDDETGSGDGWSLTAYATSFSDGSGHSLPAPSVSAASPGSTGTTCAMPTNGVAYPAGPLGTSGAGATQIFNAAPGSGSGAVDISFTFRQSLPANQLIGQSSPATFTSTATFTVSSGP
jgi:hypothetical protein